MEEGHQGHLGEEGEVDLNLEGEAGVEDQSLGVEGVEVDQHLEEGVEEAVLPFREEEVGEEEHQNLEEAGEEGDHLQEVEEVEVEVLHHLEEVVEMHHLLRSPVNVF